MSECGRYPLSNTYMFKCIEYWTKFISMSSKRYPKQCYTMIKRLGSRNLGIANKQLLYQFGFGYVWISKERGDTSVCLCVWKQSLKECAYRTLFSEINTSYKSLTFKLYKRALEPDTYIYIYIPLTYMQKMTLANFRRCSHSVMVEKL